MLTSEQQKRKPKQSKIRYTEYYDLQSIFDSLYADSLNGKTFQNLMRLIASEENIKLVLLPFCTDLKLLWLPVIELTDIMA